jgi:AAA domain
MVYGEPGVGKTLLGGTALDHTDLRPCLYLDVDGGVTTVRDRTDLDVRQVRSMAQAREIFNTLYDAVDWEADEPSLPFRSIIIDTLSELAKLDMRAIMKQVAKDNPKMNAYVPSQREYLISGERVREIVRSYRDLPTHCIFLCHSDDRKDNQNRTTFFPQFSGRLRHDIAAFIDIVGYMYADLDDRGGTERYLQVTKTKTVAAKDRTNKLGKLVVNPTLPDIWDAIHANGKVLEHATVEQES